MRDGRTVNAVNRVRRTPDYQPQDEATPYGYYHGHAILGRNSSKINDGVYLGGSAREGIVVDRDSSALENIYYRTIANINALVSDGDTIVSARILNTIKDTVRSAMPYSEPVAERMSYRYSGDKLVGLSNYVELGGGVCRQQNLLVAYLLERCIEVHLLNGTVAIERNELAAGAHAWAVYKPRPGKPATYVVVDATQDYVGSKEQALRDGAWNYSIVSNDYR